MQWIFLHGWGFSKECWEGWRKPEASYLDRGYFRNQEPLYLSPADSIVIAHSYGLHHLPQEVIPRIKKLVIIGGFVHIHTGVKSQRYLDRLLKKMTTDPEKALEQFYRDCGLEKKAAAPNVSNLKRDLVALNNSVLDIGLLREIPEVLLLHGTADRIAPFEKAIELHNFLPNSKLFPFEGKPHALPMLNAAECLERI